MIKINPSCSHATLTKPSHLLSIPAVSQSSTPRPPLSLSSIPPISLRVIESDFEYTHESLKKKEGQAKCVSEVPRAFLTASTFAPVAAEYQTCSSKTALDPKAVAAIIGKGCWTEPVEKQIVYPKAQPEFTSRSPRHLQSPTNREIPTKLLPDLPRFPPRGFNLLVGDSAARTR